MLTLVALFIGANAQADNNTIAENVQAIANLSTLFSVLSNESYASIWDALNNPAVSYTLFAPNNDAFANGGANLNTTTVATALVSETLMYHVLNESVSSTMLMGLQFPESLASSSPFVLLSGDGQVVGVMKSTSGVFTNWGIPGAAYYTSQVVEADIVCSNGYIHIINNIQSLPSDVGTIAIAANLTTFLQAALQANLTYAAAFNSLSVFAPTNDAFVTAGIDLATINQTTLANILLYHVVLGVDYSTDFANGEVLETLNPFNLTLKIDNTTGLKVIGGTNQANVIAPNLLIQNGVVHIIDKVLIPPKSAASQICSSPLLFFALVGLLFVN